MELKNGYQQTEVGVIPEDWKPIKIAKACKLINGRGFKPYEWRREGFPIIRIQNLNGSDEYNYYVGYYDRKIEVENGQLLFAWSGSRGTSFGPHVWSGEKGLLNYHTWKVDINESSIEKKFFLYALRNLTKYIEDKAHGASALVHVQKWEMEKFSFPLPPTREEQTAIATALSDTDALISRLETLIVKKRAIKQGAMQQLLKPKEGWGVKKLGEIAKFYKGKGLPKSELSESGQYKCIHYGELFTKYKEVIKNIFSCTDFNNNCFTSLSNDVLMPTSDVTPNGLAKASCLQNNNIILGGDILVIRIPSHIIYGVYLSYCITFNKEKVMQLVSGSTVYHLYGSDMARYEVDIPDIKEQNRIAQLLSDMDAEIARLEQKSAKYKLVKQGMMQELLTGKTRLI